MTGYAIGISILVIIVLALVYMQSDGPPDSGN